MPTDSDFMINEIYERNVYELNEITKDDIVTDVGAHVGTFTLKSSKSAQLVVAVEPHPMNSRYSYQT